MKRRKENDIKGLWGSQDGQAQGTQIYLEENKIYKLNMTPIFIIFMNTITSLQENTMELQKYEFSPQEH